jgi:hypothetical protein
MRVLLLVARIRVFPFCDEDAARARRQWAWRRDRLRWFFEIS